MAERANQNWESRNFCTYGPNFRMDFGNPQMGISGENVYQMYGVTDEKDQCFLSLSKSGHYKILNDRSIEITAGNKSKEEGVDIAFNAMNGGISLTCMSNGSIQLKGRNIIIDASEDVDIKAGRNLSLTAGSTLKLKGMKVQLDESSMLGNIVDTVLGSFGMRVFDGLPISVSPFSNIGTDVLGQVFSEASGVTEFAGEAVSNIAAQGAGVVNAAAPQAVAEVPVAGSIEAVTAAEDAAVQQALGNNAFEQGLNDPTATFDNPDSGLTLF
jgi:hypothetical protein